MGFKLLRLPLALVVLSRNWLLYILFISVFDASLLINRSKWNRKRVNLKERKRKREEFFSVLVLLYLFCFCGECMLGNEPRTSRAKIVQ